MDNESRTINPGVYVVVSLLFLTFSVIFTVVRHGIGTGPFSLIALGLTGITGIASGALFVHYMRREAYQTAVFKWGTFMAWLAAAFLAFMEIAANADLI